MHGPNNASIFETMLVLENVSARTLVAGNFTTGRFAQQGWTLNGTPAAETIRGTAFGEEINGLAGDDVLWGGAGNDALDGGDGVDAADFRDKTSAVVVALNGASAVVATVGGVAEDTLRNIERVFGGAGGDTLTGDAGANLLNGYGGNDVLRGGAGADILWGGTGIDTVDYSDKAVAVEVTLNGASSAAVRVGGVSEDSLRDIESVYGGSAADTLTGDALGNLFRGGGGADLIDGQGGLDAVDFRDKSTAVVLTLNGAINAVATVGGVAEDTVRNVEIVYGGLAGDTLRGDGLANQLYGMAGNDHLRGGGGGDTLVGGLGADAFVFLAIADSTPPSADATGSPTSAGSRATRSISRGIDAITGGADEPFTLGALANGNAWTFGGHLGGGEHLAGGGRRHGRRRGGLRHPGDRLHRPRRIRLRALIGASPRERSDLSRPAVRSTLTAVRRMDARV
jgi:Ca2+-binding RTX toxin-like protein